MTRVAVVSYALDATQSEKIVELENGLADVIAELIIEHGIHADDVLSRCEQATDDAVDDRNREF